MPTNAFIGLPQPPSGEELDGALGKAVHTVWDELIARLSSEGIVDGQEWKSYSKKSGWALRLKRGKRAIVYLSPFDGAFSAGFMLGDRAVQSALAAGLPERVGRTIREATRYVEGTAVRLDVRKKAHTRAVAALAAIKLAN